MEPLQAGALYPFRTIGNPACMKIKRGPDANHERHTESADIFSHETFLFGCTNTDPQNVRFRARYAFDYIAFLFGVKASERRSICAGNLKAREHFLKPFAQFVSNARIAPVKEVPMAPTYGNAAHLQHEIGAENAIHLCEALKPSHPS